MKITPETYEKMNEEFIKDNTPFRIVVPTQEAIDKWQAQPAPSYSVPPQVDMVSKQWEKLGVFSIEEREQYRKNNSGL
tara:strand:+ start:842 stop:1075 length:234 start_codon:yes stop_codon:yes gene_type:complete